MHPQRSILLAVTGMSPAVITETLYGIDRKGEEWPKEIQVITTSVGKDKIYKGLITDNHLANLCNELKKPLIAFTEAHILVVPDAEGDAVEDARSLEDHEALANFIMTTVRDFTADESTRIHASIAGGRKTMTFYLGYAMSLFGRHFDKLSHVLVTDGYEQCPDFYYPTRDSLMLQTYSKKELDAKDAEVTLADIPFIRQRSLIPDLIKQVEKKINFRSLVDLINLGEQPEAIALHVYPKQQQIIIKNRYTKEALASVTIKNILHWALYLLILEDTLKAPDERDEYKAPPAKERDDIFGLTLLLKLNNLIDTPAEGDNFDEMINSLVNRFELSSSVTAGVRRAANSLAETGFTRSSFNTYLNTIKKDIATELSSNLAGYLFPQQISQALADEELLALKEESKSTKLQGENTSRQKTASGKKGGQYYIVDLPKPHKQIFIHTEAS